MITAAFHEGEPAHSLLGFGAMRLPTLPDGTIDEVQGRRMVAAAIAGGVNYFDTAYGYHDGRSEVFLRDALSGYPRESYLLADKMPMWLVKEPEDMERIFSEQLERCGVSYFDCYLAHAVTRERADTMHRVDTVGFLEQKKAEGKIRRLGFSFHDDAECLAEVLSMTKWDFCQLQLNYADWNRFGAGELCALAGRAGVPVVVMEPVRGGFLANPPQAVAELLGAAAPGRSMAGWALRFAASQSGVKLVLSGMSHPEQVEDNLATFADSGVMLSAAEQAVMARAMELLDGMNSVPCTACRYCMPCPFGVAIPTVFALYNKAELFGGGANDYDELPAEARADRCTRCGACTALCPQSIAVPERLAEAHARLTGKV